MNTDEGYEDSAIISSKLSEDMTSYIIVLKDVSLPKNTHVPLVWLKLDNQYKKEIH